MKLSFKNAILWWGAGLFPKNLWKWFHVIENLKSSNVTQSFRDLFFFLIHFFFASIFLTCEFSHSSFHFHFFYYFSEHHQCFCYFLCRVLFLNVWKAVHRERWRILSQFLYRFYGISRDCALKKRWYYFFNFSASCILNYETNKLILINGEIK